jgi:hypothetical protein
MQRKKCNVFALGEKLAKIGQVSFSLGVFGEYGKSSYAYSFNALDEFIFRSTIGKKLFVIVPPKPFNNFQF